MAFLTDDDYKTLIDSEDLDIVQGSVVAIREEAELIAEDEIKGYINTTRYDPEQIYAATGANRNKTMIKWMMDITLYHLFTSLAGNQLNDIRVERYENAIKDLLKLQKGVIDPGLPIYPEDDNITTGQLKWGSRAKLQHGR